MTPAFKSAVTVIFAHEGGFVDNPHDKGGATKYGISQRAYPDLDIRDLTRDQAENIYHRDYWRSVRGDSVPFGIALVLFDFAVNAGVDRSIKTLQKVVGQKQDGKFGDITWAAVCAMHKNNIIEAFTTERILYYSGLKNFDKFGKGWTRRAIETMSIALLTKDML